MSWSRLTAKLIKKHLPTNVCTQLKQNKGGRQGLSLIHDNDKTHMDLTGKFAYRPNRGHKYTLIIYCHILR